MGACFGGNHGGFPRGVRASPLSARAVKHARAFTDLYTTFIGKPTLFTNELISTYDN